MNARVAYHHGNLRAALLERAIAVIETDGVEALSLRSLARELGVSHAAPARHFATKADLLSAIALDGGQRLVASTREAVEAVPAERGRAARNARRRLRALADAFVAWTVANPAHNRAMRHPDVSRHADEALIELLRGFRADIETLIDEAQHEGWQPRVERAQIVFRFVATLDGIAAVLTEPLTRAISGAAPPVELAGHTLDALLGTDRRTGDAPPGPRQGSRAKATR